ncbi:hypothetical protein GGF46_000768 [Coemansia sp. RSA 552]|nr:hypothetical protein GGF46_000768 [Coemansia sp. RSA 552]
MSLGSSSVSRSLSPEPARPTDSSGIGTRRFSKEPLLLRLDAATYAFYQTLTSARDQKLMQLVSTTANVNVLSRPANKKEFKKYGRPGEEENTRNVRLKYQIREDNLRAAGTFDPQWGFCWLLSFVILVDSPVFGLADTMRLLDLTTTWLQTLSAKDIYEIADHMPDLNAILGRAREELPCLQSLNQKIPGPFNTACSMLFAGDLKRSYVDDYLPSWVLDLRSREGSLEQPQAAPAISGALGPEMTLEEARDCVAGIVPLETAVKSSGAVDLRIKSVGTRCDGDTGLVPVRACVVDRSTMEDQGAELTLLFEQEATADMRSGFTIEATLYSLDSGHHYIDAVTMIWPSYTPMDHIEIF